MCLTSTAAADLFGSIGTHTPQRSLVEMANMHRSHCRCGGRGAVQRVRKHGIQLTSVEIQNQYDRYNRSAMEDADTQQLLGLILDAIELSKSVDTDPPVSAPLAHQPYTPTTLLPPLDSQSGPPIKGIIGSGPAMQEVYRLTRQVAQVERLGAAVGRNRHGQGIDRQGGAST